MVNIYRLAGAAITILVRERGKVNLRKLPQAKLQRRTKTERSNK